jgi:triacylglycerol lipase
MPQQSRKKAGRLADKKATEIPLRMRLQCPIADLSILQRSVFFAEAALIGYLSPAECTAASVKLGFSDCQYFEGEGGQAFIYSNQFDTVVVCRGIEAADWSDISSEVDAHTVLAETVGRVQRGFKLHADELWPLLETALEKYERPLWFTGHSLGGALASICAMRCVLSGIKSEPEQLYTFGSPRVGNGTYVNQVKLAHYRWVNKNDVVPHVPPVWFGFRHSGEELHINRMGQLSSQDGQALGHWMPALMGGLVRIRPGQLADHSITEYVEAIASLQRRQEPDVKLPSVKTESRDTSAGGRAERAVAGQPADKSVSKPVEKSKRDPAVQNSLRLGK